MAALQNKAKTSNYGVSIVNILEEIDHYTKRA